MLPLMTLIGLTFNHVPASRGVSLLHSPEKWAAGAGLMAGIPPFRIWGVKGPFVVGKECMVELNTQGLMQQRLRLVAREPEAVTVTLGHRLEDKAHTTVHARVTPLSPDGGGFMLVLDVDGDWEVDTGLLKESLQAALWGCVDETGPGLAPLRRYREHLGL